jgi:single-stranded DNA-binding protein
VTAAKTLAKNIVESLSKGDRIFVHGTVTTEAWTDKDTGGKRTAQRVLAEIVGPNLRWAPPGSPRPPACRATTKHSSRGSDQALGQRARRDPASSVLYPWRGGIGLTRLVVPIVVRSAV